MKTEHLIPLAQLCLHYQVEMSFFNDLHEIGLIEITTVKKTLYLHSSKINAVEKIIRLHHELDVNIEGIDVIFNLLEKLDAKDNELNALKNRLRIYEG